MEKTDLTVSPLNGVPNDNSIVVLSPKKSNMNKDSQQF